MTTFNDDVEITEESADVDEQITVAGTEQGRSIYEIEKEIKANGYGDLTDDEIERYWSFKAYYQYRQGVADAREANLNERFEQMRADAAAAREVAEAQFAQALAVAPVFNVVNEFGEVVTNEQTQEA